MHISELHTEVFRGEFSLEFVSEAGERITLPRCVCTSFHSSGRTMNVMLCESGEVRKINRLTIVKFNNREIFL